MGAAGWVPSVLCVLQDAFFSAEASQTKTFPGTSPAYVKESYRIIIDQRLISVVTWGLNHWHCLPICPKSAPVRVECEGRAAAWLAGTLVAPSVQGHVLPLH